MTATKSAILLAMVLSVCAFSQYRKTVLIETFSNYG
jgi:hypothetical protein